LLGISSTTAGETGEAKFFLAGTNISAGIV
jgi:hypothetical protein